MLDKCYFCGSRHLKHVREPYIGGKPNKYTCPSCGPIDLDEDFTEHIIGHPFTPEQKNILSIRLRTKYENENQKSYYKKLALDDLIQLIDTYRPLDAIEKMDIALLNLDKETPFIGEPVVLQREDLPYYHCFRWPELVSIFQLLYQTDYITVKDPQNPHSMPVISAKGYEKLRELKKPGKDFRQCFVAMWLAPEMLKVYEKTIKPAIEYVEENETEPRFKSLLIVDKEHTNDINDEIIAEIRRSRFMVCDLTGYRGGVYFEAGFAFGLGLEVIYTCREDWLEKEILKNKQGEKVKTLYDSGKRAINVSKSGVHFDLEHRNRISWTEDNLDEFEKKLTNRIKAVIV